MLSISICFKANEWKFSVSFDAWTSSNGHVFVAIVSHWIDNDGKLHKPLLLLKFFQIMNCLAKECLIDFAELTSDYSSESLADAVWKTLDTYGLKGRVRITAPFLLTDFHRPQIVVFVMDDATNNDNHAHGHRSEVCYRQNQI
jgi:hypothetical protein